MGLLSGTKVLGTTHSHFVAYVPAVRRRSRRPPSRARTVPFPRREPNAMGLLSGTKVLGTTHSHFVAYVPAVRYPRPPAHCPWLHVHRLWLHVNCL